MVKNAGYRPTKISGLATYVPPRLLTNKDLEKLVDTSDEWILQRTGIRERHVVDAGVATSDLAKEAALKAIAHAGLTPHDIDFIVVGTTTPDMMFPSTACLVQNKIGADRAWGFDLGAACSGFTYALTTAAHMVAAGTHRHALAIGADVMSSIIDYTDRSTCVLFGDGAGAVVVSPATDNCGIIDFAHEVDGGGGPALCMPAGGSLRPASHETVDQRLHYVKQDGGTVFKFAVRKTEEICARVMERNTSRPRTSICSCRTRPTGASSCRPRSAWDWRPRRSSSTSKDTATPRPGRFRSRWLMPSPTDGSKGQPGAARFCWRRLYGGVGPPALVDLSEHRSMRNKLFRNDTFR